MSDLSAPAPTLAEGGHRLAHPLRGRDENTKYTFQFRDVNDIERQNARLRCTLAERGLDGAFRAGHSAALGIALCALTGEEFTRARQLITDAILREVDSLHEAHP